MRLGPLPTKEDITHMNVKDMTNEHLNIELSKLLGKTEKNATQINYGHICDYCTDAVTSSELQEKIIGIDTERYVRNLGGVVSDWKNEKYKWNTVAKLLTATPRQIAEAAYMTLREDI